MKNKRKTCLLTNNLAIGGAEKVFRGISDSFSEKGLNFDVVLLNGKIDYPIQCKPIIICNISYNIFISLLLAVVVFPLLCLKHKYQVVQSHLFWSNYINSIFQPLFCYESQIVHCVSFNSKFPSGIKRYVHLLLGKTFYSKNTIHIFKSKEMQAEYIQLFGLNITNTIVIYNPVTKVASGLQRKNKYVKFTCLNIAVVGRFHSTKRHHSILSIAEELRGKVKFHCIGTGELYNSFESSVISRGLQKEIKLYGWSDNPDEIIRKECDLYTSFSSSEGFPNALLEAMRLGIPVSHTDCLTGPKEILNDSTVQIIYSDKYKITNYGVLFDSNTPENFKYLALDIFTGKVLLDNFIFKSLKRYEHYYKINTFDMYEQIIKRGKNEKLT